MTPHWIGQIIRRKLGIKTEKRHGNYMVAAGEGPKLARLFEKYGIVADHPDLGDSGDCQNDVQAQKVRQEALNI